jgi:hypothetical protein
MRRLAEDAGYLSVDEMKRLANSEGQCLRFDGPAPLSPHRTISLAPNRTTSLCLCLISWCPFNSQATT